MSAYPMKLRSVSFDHTGGTKSYHLLIVETADGKSLFVSRWGKKGAFGELKAEMFPTVAAGEKAFDKKERQKTSSGYRQTGPSKSDVANNAAELRAAMGLPTWSKVGAGAISHLDPAIDTKGMRDAEPNRVGEDGRLTGQDAARKVDVSQALAAQKEADRIESERILAANPNYGRF